MDNIDFIKYKKEVKKVDIISFEREWNEYMIPNENSKEPMSPKDVKQRFLEIFYNLITNIIHIK